jgi:ubiquinone/menaquinone biosynthesis C-methylase UbiE
MIQADSLIPSDAMIAENSGGIDRQAYIDTGAKVVEQAIIQHAGLQPHQKFLDVGCGCAKIARPLVAYLSSEGEYHGIDVVKECIDWCESAYRDYPNFKFHYADLFSTRYNQTGSSPASRYKFPLPSNHFDVAFLGSVFTHLLPAEVTNYLAELARVLKPGGRVLATFFVLDDVARSNVEAAMTAPAFPFLLPRGSGCRVQNLDCPEAAIAYEESYVREIYPKAGLELEEIVYGQWGREKLLPHWQDAVWAHKPRWIKPPSASRDNG